MDKHEVWGLKLSPDEIRYDVGGFRSYFEAFFTFAIEDVEYGNIFKQYASELLKKCY